MKISDEKLTGLPQFQNGKKKKRVDRVCKNFLQNTILVRFGVACFICCIMIRAHLKIDNSDTAARIPYSIFHSLRNLRLPTSLVKAIFLLFLLRTKIKLAFLLLVTKITSFPTKLLIATTIVTTYQYNSIQILSTY